MLRPIGSGSDAVKALEDLAEVALGGKSKGGRDLLQREFGHHQQVFRSTHLGTENIGGEIQALLLDKQMR